MRLHQLLPSSFMITIVGYARSSMSAIDFRSKISAKFGSQHAQSVKDAFLAHCWYHQGQYDSADDFSKLNDELKKVEEKGASDSAAARNRIFYMALPPTAFVPAAKSIAEAARAQQGYTKIVIEKPNRIQRFGSHGMIDSE